MATALPQTKPRRGPGSEEMCVSLILLTKLRAVAVVDRFTQTRFAAFLRRHLAHRFTRPSQTVFLLLALGFVLSPVRHTVANYLWRSGACLVRHFTRFYAFLGGPFFCEMDALWRAVIRLAAGQVADGAPIRVRVDETVCKKTGPRVEPADTYRNGAGTARQEYRTLYGICFVLGEMLMPLPGEPEKADRPLVSVPIGLEVYLKEEKADELGRPYVRRSALGRRLVERVAEEVGPQRRVLSVQDGNYATQHFLRKLPPNADVVGRLPKNSPLYARPEPKPEGKPGPQPTKGCRLGSPEELAEGGLVWQDHPTEEGAEIYSLEAIWHSVLPGRLLKVVIVQRPDLKDAPSAQQRRRWLEVFFTTNRRLSPGEILSEYRGRWSVEILIREARESFGLGKDRCRNVRKITSINNFRLLIGAAEVLYTAETQEANAQEANSQDPMEAFYQLRPWYRDLEKPKLFDIHWSIREELAAAGVTPKVGLRATLEEFEQNKTSARPRAA